MYELIVIGCGSGGYAAAIRASQLGIKTAVVEAADIGGTCVNRGCIPTKVWRKAADIVRTMKRAEEFGIKVQEPSIDFKVIIDRKNGVASDIKMGMQGLLSNYGVDFLKGHAVFKSPTEIDIEGKSYEAKSYIIASGSKVTIPEIQGLHDALMTTDDVLEMVQAPKSILIYGAGIIEVEMANILQMFGSNVTIATDGHKLLPKEDQDTSHRMAGMLRENGVGLKLRSTLTSVEKRGRTFVCNFTGAKENSIEADRVLICTRVPSVAGLGLEKISVDLTDEGGIKVNEYLETSVPNIYAIGDCTGGWMLSHQGSGMAVFAAENIMGVKRQFPANSVPRGCWTWPEIGSVGYTEEGAERAGYQVEVGNFPYSINGMAMCQNEMEGSVKIIADEKYGDILGVHIVGRHATELIGEAALAMQLECTAGELARGIRNHPTFSEAVVDAARDACSWALYLPKV